MAGNSSRRGATSKGKNKAAGSGGGASDARPGPRRSTVPISASATTGRPAAIASSSTRPWVSVREANTNTSAAA